MSTAARPLGAGNTGADLWRQQPPKDRALQASYRAELDQQRREKQEREKRDKAEREAWELKMDAQASAAQAQGDILHRPEGGILHKRESAAGAPEDKENAPRPKVPIRRHRQIRGII